MKIKLSQSSSEWEKYKIRDIVEVKEEKGVYTILIDYYDKYAFVIFNIDKSKEYI